jgi:hypothetical protein
MADVDVKCLKCGGQNPSSYSFCTVCGEPVQKKKTGSAGAVCLFVLALLFWVVGLQLPFFGFVLPVNGEAVGRDAFEVGVWLWLYLSGRKVYRVFFVENKLS